MAVSVAASIASRIASSILLLRLVLIGYPTNSRFVSLVRFGLVLIVFQSIFGVVDFPSTIRSFPALL
jgi:hypothetical protein